MRQIFAFVAVLAVAACGSSGTPASANPINSSPPASAKPSDRPSQAAASPLAIEGGEAWIATQPQDRKHVLLIRPDGSGSAEILRELPHEQLRPDWSPDGERLAFEHTPEGWGADVRDIWISDADGSNAEPLVAEYPAGLEGLWWTTPAWSRDGNTIAMVGLDANAALFLPGRSVLALVDLATRELSVVSETESANNGSLHNNPRWSNDGTGLVLTLDHFEGDQAVGSTIAIIERSGAGWSELEVITEVEQFSDHADWHPAEDLIVFCTYDYGPFHETDEPSNLYTMRPDGSGRTQLTHYGPGEFRATQPGWTSDGRIIFTLVTGDGDLTQRPAFIGADGSRLQVVDAGENVVYPRLRPTPAD